MAFKFSLAAVLKFRAMIEEREERLLHQIALQVSQARDELELTGQKILAAYASLGQESEGAATGYTVQAAYGEVKYLTEARKETGTAHREARGVAGQAAQDLRSRP